MPVHPYRKQRVNLLWVSGRSGVRNKEIAADKIIPSSVTRALRLNEDAKSLVSLIAGHTKANCQMHKT